MFLLIEFKVQTAIINNRVNGEYLSYKLKKKLILVHISYLLLFIYFNNVSFISSRNLLSYKITNVKQRLANQKKD